MRHLTQVVRNGMGDRGAPESTQTQVVQGKTVCVVSWSAQPGTGFLWKGMEATTEGDFFGGRARSSSPKVPGIDSPGFQVKAGE